ncbi:MAG: nucleoside phosphorylase [Prevotella sp.]|nr:nucleoside phosphorylase [Prevotella sp.]MBR4571851.1 nucleoside phosphorylase [Prevotella sp.]
MIPPSELPINADGSVFHLHLRPEQIADKIILVGDPGRVKTVASFFDSIECEVQSREFHTITGTYKGKRISCVSTGIGCDNIDIVMTELDALVNIDLDKRELKNDHTTLTLVRIGTCGGLQTFTPLGSFIASVKSIGFDGLLNYYEGRDEVCDLALEEAFCKHMKWSPKKGAPYVAIADEELINRVAAGDMVRGITISCGGFYGPQGRFVRLIPKDYEQNLKVETFSYIDPHHPDAAPLEICNFEMESSAVAGLSALLGHKAMTCCMVVANRYTMEMNTEYKSSITDLIQLVLDRI